MTYGKLPALALVLFFLTVSGCKSPSSLSAKALGCRTAELDMLDSEFSRSGSTTTWCARCGGQTHICVTNPNRSRIECREVPAGPPCE
jgi:hypothetical protein